MEGAARTYDAAALAYAGGLNTDTNFPPSPEALAAIGHPVHRFADDSCFIDKKNRNAGCARPVGASLPGQVSFSGHVLQAVSSRVSKRVVSRSRVDALQMAKGITGSGDASCRVLIPADAADEFHMLGVGGEIAASDTGSRCHCHCHGHSPSLQLCGAGAEVCDAAHDQ